VTTLPPYLAFREHRARYVAESVTYHGSQRLDIWRDDEQGAHHRHPVLIFVPGGAWVSGSRATGQGHALMSRMTQLGWMCLSIDYRTAPLHRWPAQREDVEAAVGWARENVSQYGGDPNFVAIAGASAGGHLATLTGLRPRFVDAAVSIYGSYDWTDRSTLWRKMFMTYLERVIVGHRHADRPDIFRDASPLLLANIGAAPTMIVHGTADTLIPVSEARWFHRRLADVSASSVDYLEIPGALHGFDLVNPGQTVRATRAIAEFLDRELSAARSTERIVS
jgi:acetyl esterase/lipase